MNLNKHTNSKILIWIFLGIILSVSLIIYFLFNIKSSLEEKNISYNIGTADYCKKNPLFIKKMKIEGPIAIDMTQKKAKGLVMISGGKERKPFQLPTWDDAGYLGPYALDENGNIYVAPIPFVSIEAYPPEKQSVIYIVHSETGELQKFMDIPWAQSPHEKNPFNILGLAYDCDTKSLYVSSVSGSTFENEVGRIYQIDLKSKKITAQIDKIDAIGLGIFNFKTKKKLYFGLARSPDIKSISLDNEGHFIQDIQHEFSLNELPGGSYDKCHRIRFLKNNTMELKGIDFNYSLHAESDVQRNIYNFKYDDGNWKFVEVHKQ